MGSVCEWNVFEELVLLLPEDTRLVFIVLCLGLIHLSLGHALPVVTIRVPFAALFIQALGVEEEVTLEVPESDAGLESLHTLCIEIHIQHD
jgi:hypothetical protein